MFNEWCKTVGEEERMRFRWQFSVSLPKFDQVNWEKIGPWLVALVLSLISIFYFAWFSKFGLGLAYNDARSLLDIAR